MTGSAIQQLVHGYEHGHSLLASSTDLGRDDLDLVGRLSDLSGTLGSGLEVSPYLSVYPLPSKKYFAVAKTWPDESAPRSGCVLTHTILIPLEAWATDGCPSRFASVLKKPTRDRIGDFKVAVESVSEAEAKVTAREPFGEAFIQRYFGEGLAPIAWFGALAPERAAWCVIQALWPSLRAHFACCTLALQPRTLTDRPFDLVFAPTAVFSRFGEFARAHVVDGRVPLDAETIEPWLRSWSECVFESSPAEVCARVRALSSNLDSHPTSIRAVLFFLELQKRAENSPTAAIGALDLLEKLAPQPSEGQQEKSALVTAAMRSIATLPTHDAQELLYLLCERLEEHSFVAPDTLQLQIRCFAKRLIEDDPEQGITDANSLAARHTEATPSLFMIGIGDALMTLLRSDRLSPAALVQKPALMERIIADYPEIAATMLQCSGRADREQIVFSIVEWCRAKKVAKVRSVLRRFLLPEVNGASDAPLVEELLRDLVADEVPEVCNLIESRTAYRTATLSALVSRLVGERHPYEVRTWSRFQPWSSYQSAVVISASFATTADGMRELLDEHIEDSGKQSLLLAAFINSASAFSTPDWLLVIMEERRQCWEVLLPALNDQPVSDAVIRLVRGGLRRSSMARVSGAVRCLAIPKKADFNIVKEYALRQHFADYFEELCDVSEVKCWFEEPWVAEALTRVRADFISTVIAEQLGRSDKSWPRAWTLVENIPDKIALKNEDLVHNVVSILLLAASPQWTLASVDNWRALLSRVSRQDRVCIRLCGQALHFAFEHPQLPLAAVVAEAFYPVHAEAMKDDQNRGHWWSRGFGSWDKAIDLRRSLVDSFVQSNWPPYYFALAAREPWLLKKLCKRMLRQWKGRQFLESAYSKLKKVSTAESQDLTSILHQILQNPEVIEEEWD